ncbi:hypothetical protein I6F35_38180 [Bradyrhizobium sp. BRP22]|nr:hypothetical protein [Bradyrhizobium sp. BRP22]
MTLAFHLWRFSERFEDIAERVCSAVRNAPHLVPITIGKGRREHRDGLADVESDQGSDPSLGTAMQPPPQSGIVVGIVVMGIDPDLNHLDVGQFAGRRCPAARCNPASGR